MDPESSLPLNTSRSGLGRESGVSRRKVLRGGAAGISLAASGLLVSAPAEVDAAERPLDRPRDRGDAQHRRNDHSKPSQRNRHKPGLTRRKNMEFVFVAGKTLTHDIEVWQEDPTGRGTIKWVLAWSRRNVSSGQRVTFTGSEPRLALVNFSPGINSKSAVFQAVNPLAHPPNLVIAQGTWGKLGIVNRGDTYVDKRMSERQQVFVDGFQVTRYTDSPNYKIFVIEALD